MVQIDLGIKELIGLFENASMDIKKLEEHLNTFKKEDFISFLLDENKEEEIPEEEDTPI